MENNSIDLMQYALVGGAIFVVVAIGISALYLKSTIKRDAKREEKRKKKEAKRAKKRNQQQEELVEAESVSQVQQEVPKEVASVSQVQEVLKETASVSQVHQEVPQKPLSEVEAGNLPGETVVVSIPIEKCNPRTIYLYKVKTTEKDENKKISLEESLTIGRNIGYRFWTIEGDPTVSGNHCKIYQKHNEIYILDLNSTNGTYVNGERITEEVRLANHDKIRIGQSEYRVGI